MPADADTDNEYEITVKVSDGSLSAERNVTVTVTDENEAPTITTTATTVNVAENSTAVDVDFEATDVDSNGESNDSGNTLTWSVETAAVGGKFTIDAMTGALSFTAAPDFEMPDDVGGTADDNKYVVTVKVTDNDIDGARTTANHESDTHQLTVTVTNVNEAPVITTTAATHTAFSVDENTATDVVIKTYEATDVDANIVLTWTLESEDAGHFTLTKNSTTGHGELKFKNVPDYEMPADDADNDGTDGDNVYDITVKVTDNHSPTGEKSLDVAVTVNDVNETPVITGDDSHDYEEIAYDNPGEGLGGDRIDLHIGTYGATDDDGDGITWGLSGADKDHFTIIQSNGELRWVIEPDFENPDDDGSNNVYDIVVEATDDNTTVTPHNQKGTFPVTVTVTNRDETPEVMGNETPDFAEIEWDATTADLVVETYEARDEEGETITWTLSGDDAGDFTITKNAMSSTGVLSFRQRPDYEDPMGTPLNPTDDPDNTYHIIVRATDGNTSVPNLTNVTDYEVTVTDVNERPDITEDFQPPQTYAEIEYDFSGTLPDVHTFTATDYDDGDTFSWTLTGEDAADLDIGGTSGVLTFDQTACTNDHHLPDFDEPCDGATGGSNTYNVTVVATDNHGKAEEYPVTITVTDVNEQPEFTGTVTTTVPLDEHDGTLDATGNETPYVATTIASYTARDEEGGVTWSLTGTDAGDFNIDSGAVTFAETPNFESPNDSGGNNVYEFNVVVTDVASQSPRLSVNQTVTVTVNDVEEAGSVFIAGGDESPGVDEFVTFNLSDPHDGHVNVERQSQSSWTVQRGSPGSWSTASGVLSRSSTHQYTAQEDDTGHQLRAAVTYEERRGTGKTATSAPTDVVTADPRVNVPPRIRDRALVTVEGPAVIDFGTIQATDRDGDSITFNLLEVDHHDLFEISSRGQLRAVQELDFEDGASLRITVTLSDGKDDDGNADDAVDVTAGLTIAVQDVGEPGVITFSSEQLEVGTQLTTTLTDDDGDVSGASWQWARSENGRTGWSNISGATSSSYTPVEADEDNYLRASADYTDRRGGGKRAEAVTAGAVPSENRRPAFPSTEDGARTVAENTRSGQSIGAPVAAEDPESDRLTYSLSGDDAAAFTIVSSTGQIRTKDSLDFEAKSTYSVTIEVHDGRDSAGQSSTDTDDTQDVTITVENVEEPSTVTLNSLTQTIQARVEVTAVLVDQDVVNQNGTTWQWSRSPNGRTNWVNIAGATSATYTLTLGADTGNYLRATVSYADGHGSGKTARAISSRVGEPPPVNSAPAFPTTEDGRREVPEDAVGGTAIGDPVTANDVNAGDLAVNDPLAYSLMGADAATFTINASTGRISLASGETLDYEGKRTHRVTVQVTDGRDQNGDDDNDAINDTQAVTITVTGVNEAPVVSGNETPSIQENSSATIATYSAADPERDTVQRHAHRPGRRRHRRLPAVGPVHQRQERLGRDRRRGVRQLRGDRR